MQRNAHGRFIKTNVFMSIVYYISIIYRFNIFDSFDGMTWSYYVFWIKMNPQAPAECNGFVILLRNAFFSFLLFLSESRNYINWNAIFGMLIVLLSELSILSVQGKKEDFVANDQREFTFIKFYLINTIQAIISISKLKLKFESWMVADRSQCVWKKKIYK